MRIDFDPGNVRRARVVVGCTTGPDFELDITTNSSESFNGAVVGAVDGSALDTTRPDFVPGNNVVPLRYATYAPTSAIEQHTAATLGNEVRDFRVSCVGSFIGVIFFRMDDAVGDLFRRRSPVQVAHVRNTPYFS